jgi:MFS family permease
MNYHRCRLRLLCLALSIGTRLPTQADLYVCNTAFAVLQAYLAQGLGSAETAARLWPLYVSLEFLGAVVGSMLTPLLPLSWGRPRTLAAAMLFLCFPGRCLQAAASLRPALWPLLFAGKLTAGLGNGGVLVVLPVLLCEIAPPAERGRLGLLPSFSSSLAGVLGAALGTQAFLGTAARWPLIYVLLSAASLLAPLLLLCCPETPPLCLLRSRGQSESWERLCS